MLTHELKTWPEYFEAVWNNNKTFEVRKQDRAYNVGDTLHLKEFYYTTQKYSGREIKVKVTYMLMGGQFGVDEDFCVMGFNRVYVSDVPFHEQDF